MTAFPKDDGRKTQRELKAAAVRKLRPETRAKAYALDGGRCIWPTCRTRLTLEFAHEHEVLWRGRGGDPTELEIVVTLCPECHSHIHPRVGGLKKKMDGTRTAGFTFFEKRDNEWVEVKAEVAP